MHTIRTVGLSHFIFMPDTCLFLPGDLSFKAMDYSHAKHSTMTLRNIMFP